MYKILYVQDKYSKALDIPEDKRFQIKIFKLGNINNLNLNSYEECLIKICPSNLEYMDNVVLLKRTNPNLNFWAVCEDFSEKYLQAAIDLNIKNIIKMPLDFDLIEKNINYNKKVKLLKKETYSIFSKFYNPKILIIESSEQMIEYFVDVLSIFRPKISGTVNILEAIRWLNKYKFDLVIINAYINQFEKFEIGDIVRYSSQNDVTPIMFLFSNNLSESFIDKYMLGSTCFVKKPINIVNFRNQVYGILKLNDTHNMLFNEHEKLYKILNFSNDEIILMDALYQVVSRNYKIISEDVEIKTIFQIKWINYFEISTKFTEFKASDKKSINFKSKIENGDDVVSTSVSVSKIFDKERNITGFVAIMRDITEDIKIQRQKDSFIATLTHDLKTPIRAQINALSLMLNKTFGDMSPDLKMVIEEIYISCNFLKNMTDNLLMKYKYENGQLKICKTPNNLKVLLEKVEQNLKYLLSQKEQKLYLQYEAKVESFDFDSVEIARVVNNLITNASEYSPEKAHIMVKVQDVDKNFLEISVKDEGVGISDEYIGLVFNEFETTAKKYSKVGSGLGLFISKKIIEAHGGEIWVKANNNQGCTFFFTLPIYHVKNINYDTYIEDDFLKKV